MSNRALAWAQDRSDTKPGARFVLVTLGDLADENDSCFPSIRHLSAKTGYKETAIRVHLADLEQAGYLTVVEQYRNNGGRTSNRYQLHLNMLARTDVEEAVDNSTPPLRIRGGVPSENGRGGPSESEGAIVNPHKYPSNGQVNDATTDGPVDNSAAAASHRDGRSISTPKPSTLAGLHGHGLSTPDVFASVGHILAATNIDDAGMHRLAAEILSKHRGRVLNPTAYVVTQLRDPRSKFEWVARAYVIAGEVYVERAAAEAAARA